MKTCNISMNDMDWYGTPGPLLVTFVLWVRHRSPGTPADGKTMQNTYSANPSARGVPVNSSLLNYLSTWTRWIWSNLVPHPLGYWASLHDRQVVEECNWDLWPSDCMPQHCRWHPVPGMQVAPPAAHRLYLCLLASNPSVQGRCQTPQG